MTILRGIGGSKGYGRGTAVVNRRKSPDPGRYTITDPAAEEQRFRTAQAFCGERLNKLLEDSDSHGDEAGEIISAYLSILHDEAFFKKALKRLDSELVNIEYLIRDECLSVMDKFAALDDPYLMERAVDIENVCNELIRALLGEESDFVINPVDGKGIIVVAEDLTPAETMKMDKNVLRGFVTEKGGATSHTVILAKSLGIPAIVGASGALKHISDGDLLLLDAFTGTIAAAPDKDCLSAFDAACLSYEKKLEEYEKGVSLPAVTLDGHQVYVNVNTGDTEGIRNLNMDNCDGVGLLRTEFLYMGLDDYPDEETQFAVYRDIAEKANGKEVIIRTLDIGGDKQVDYMDLPKEDNPFLGYRAIRLCLDRREVFHTQLRAILRASAHGNVKIMFPMIVSSEELIEARRCVEQAKSTLRQDKIEFNEDIPVGIMVETPAAVLVSEQLAQIADFFSIGSNDLIQYITASDRMNERVQNLYDSCSPAVLRAICIVAHNAKDAQIPWGICGEVASEERLIPLWVTLGVSELSVSPSMTGRVKALVRRVDRKVMLPVMESILDIPMIENIKQELDAVILNLENI